MTSAQTKLFRKSRCGAAESVEPRTAAQAPRAPGPGAAVAPRPPPRDGRARLRALPQLTLIRSVLSLYFQPPPTHLAGK